MARCKNCGAEGTGNYCSACGQPLQVKRITVHSLLHEVGHLFTHFEKGTLYTLKQLATRPGFMQKDYLLGQRSKHQKPFSLFFLCATLAGLAIYWISKPATTLPLDSFQEKRVDFYRHYFVILQALLIPFYTLVNWLLFRKKDFYNYAEALILFIYSLAFLLLVIIFTNSINLLHLDFETPYIEIPLLAIYTIWTNLNFFNNEKRWIVILKSIVGLLICWFTSNLLTDQVIERLM